jgi:Ni/Co efflux regulator RcnB
MAGFGIPEMMAIQSGISGAGLLHGIASSSAAASHAQSQAAAQAQAVQAQAERQRQLLERQYESQTRQRTNLLERATAKARVSFEARGISPTDGSAGAMLDGIETDFGIEEAERFQDYTMQRDGLAHGLAASLQRIDGMRQGNLLAAESDVQRRILGLLSWGGRTFGRSGGNPRGPVGDFPTGLYDNLA